MNKTKRSGSEVRVVKKEVRKFCARNTSLIYGIKNPIGSPNGLWRAEGAGQGTRGLWAGGVPSTSLQIIFRGTLGLLETHSRPPRAFSSWQGRACPHLGSLSAALAGAVGLR